MVLIEFTSKEDYMLIRAGESRSNLSSASVIASVELCRGLVCVTATGLGDPGYE